MFDECIVFAWKSILVATVGLKGIDIRNCDVEAQIWLDSHFLRFDQYENGRPLYSV